MIDVTYAEVEPLLAGAVQEGEVLRCTFRCPVSGEEVEGRAPLVRGRTLEDVSAGEPRSLFDAVRGAVRAVFHSELAGPGAGTGGQDAPEFSERERKAAVLVAFDGVSSRFVYDATAGRWLGANAANELLSDFARQLALAPVRRPHDRALAARLLAEVARADGRVTPDEWRYLGELAPGEQRSVDSSMELPPLSDEELGSASGGAARDTMLLLAWTLALADDEVAADETGPILRYARGLRIPQERALELRRFAAEHLVEEGLRRAYRGRRVHADRREEARALGARLGVEPARLDAVEARLQARLGIAAA